MKRIVSALLAGAVCMGLLGGCGTQGDGANAAKGGEWPARPITVIVPYGAGGDTDFNARA